MRNRFPGEGTANGLDKLEGNSMDERTRELIAIGASITAHCQPCLEWHVDKARELGIDEDTIKAAIETGQMVEKGAMSAMRKYAGEVTAQKTAGNTSCCSEDKQSNPSCCS
jgi:AhpD family alkylhydroperoxidase